ncbi:gap junction beta-7 protein [Platysternon megacephalum]|uniref:Gap junction beta-7 protein n=1 Tax=Platysternon megacephalum TaxID=55544 RepID=A0A4D9F3S2_9SAUR|nr:gap junction beta-7 protein [Platysternon megacephalum]
MASLRRVKVLLVLNLIAVAGFVLFLAKCRPITVKSGDSFHEIHPRAEVANLTAHGISPIQDAVLKRLSLLEDIVYRQLNGRNCCHSFDTFGAQTYLEIQIKI